MTIAVVNYLRFKSRTGAYQGGYNFQNFFVGESRNRSGVTHVYAPFGITSGAGAKGGDRTDASIIAPTDPLAVNLFVEACQENWLAEITSVLLDPATYAEVQQISRESWVCARPELTPERAVLRLASPLDAVDTQVPKRTLSSRLVGSLPSTGSISVS